MNYNYSIVIEEMVQFNKNLKFAVYNIQKSIKDMDKKTTFLITKSFQHSFNDDEYELMKNDFIKLTEMLNEKRICLDELEPLYNKHCDNLQKIKYFNKFYIEGLNNKYVTKSDIELLRTNMDTFIDINTNIAGQVKKILFDLTDNPKCER